MFADTAVSCGICCLIYRDYVQKETFLKAKNPEDCTAPPKKNPKPPTQNKPPLNLTMKVKPERTLENTAFNKLSHFEKHHVN